LLSNAVKHSAPDAPVLLEVESDGSEIVFRVKDDGMGIPESDLKCLFTPFYRGRNSAHIPGTGLGLVIVKRCVERHGGAVEIVSHEGVGTTAIARLPKYTPGNTERFNKARVRPPQSTNHETNSHH
jgi:signal transduction histidine kinase